MLDNFPYPLWPAIQEESSVVKGERNLGVVMTQAPVHLPSWAYIQDGLHRLWPRVLWGSWVVLAETCPWVADEEGLDSAEGVFVKKEGSRGFLIDIVGTDAMVDSVWACSLDILWDGMVFT